MIMAVEVRGARAPEVAPRLLEEIGGEARAFGGSLNALRVSPNLMTTDEELDRFLEAAARAAS
jgi:selenocysteine lyase/cysteine desulfurase